MKKHIISGVLILPLCGCLHWQDFNPFHTKETLVPVVAETPVEKIGPDVIAVPVEPVEAQDMLNSPAPAAVE